MKVAVKNPKRDIKVSIHEFAQKNGIRTSQDWYKLTPQQLRVIKTTIHLKKNDLINTLHELYPNERWEIWKFEKLKKPSIFWESSSNQRKFLEWMEKQLGITNRDEWYDKATVKLFQEYGADGLTRYHRWSVASVLQTNFPEHPWQPWKFIQVSTGFWNEPQNKKTYLDYIGSQLGVLSPSDWNKVKEKDVKNLDNAGIFRRESLVEVLKTCYPDFNWTEWKFHNRVVERNFWDQQDNQKVFVEWVGKQLGVVNLEDWYKITRMDIKRLGGTSLFRHYRSMHDLLSAIYPHHSWKPWKFKSNHFYQTLLASSGQVPPQIIAQVLQYISQEYSVTTMEDWYRVSERDLRGHGLRAIVTRLGGLKNMLQSQYPEYKWNSQRFSLPSKKSSQRMLTMTLKKLFPNEKILEDYQHSEGFESHRPVELDIFIPSRSLAFEYQGKHHFMDVGFFGPAVHYRKRDDYKRQVCANNNIKLVEVPYWWDKTPETLMEFIQKASPQALLPS